MHILNLTMRQNDNCVIEGIWGIQSKALSITELELLITKILCNYTSMQWLKWAALCQCATLVLSTNGLREVFFQIPLKSHFANNFYQEHKFMSINYYYFLMYWMWWNLISRSQRKFMKTGLRQPFSCENIEKCTVGY